MTTPYLQIQSIKKVYGDVTAVENVTLDVKEGEFLTFLGPSGSGKSTTLYILAGFQDPTRGDILLNGKTLLNTEPHKRQIGMVFQRYTLFPHLSVGENVAFPLRVRRTPRAEIAERVQKALKLVRLDGFEDRMPAALSGGQQQRVALARALVYDPPVLLMDEPLSALDKKLREEIQYEIRRIHRETGVTILYVTHDQEEALRLSDRIAVFNAGQIEQVGTGNELYENPSTQFVAGFIGDSDFIDCTILASDGGQAEIQLPSGQRMANIPLHGQSAATGRANLMLRPERIRLSKQNDIGMVARVTDLTFLGNNTNVTVETEWQQVLSVRIPFGADLPQNLRAGDQVSLNWDAASGHVFPEI